ncbi:hypothetical protein, partial [Streptomyces sp. SID3343]|uniref:hypothetical protein n=1 Tax=Streptomyces sp. SID3343 TaxID=2690260 RepID=UPI0013C0E773
RGTLPSLLTAIADGTVTATPDKPGGPPPTLTKPYRFLLTATDPDDLRDLLPGLPDALVHDLLSGGGLPAAVHDAAIGSTDERAWVAVARNAGLDIRDLARLVAKQLPAVDAAAYRNVRSTPSLRRTIAAREPLDADLRAELLQNSDSQLLRNADRRTLAPLLVSGDPELVACALRFGCRKTAQQYAYVRVWERNGPDAVRALLAASGTGTATQIRNRIEAALKSGTGPADLRASGEPYEDPATLPKLFQTRTSRTTVRDLVHEPYAHDFPLLMSAHRESRFATEAIDDLLRHEDATDEDRTSLRLAMINSFRGHHRIAVDIDPAEWLRTEGFGRAGSWANEAVAHGVLDPTLLVDVAYPARDVVSGTTGFDQDAVLAPMRIRLAELTRTHLAGHAEAFAIALGLIDTFEASLAELITIAAQAAGPPPAAEELARDAAAALEQALREAASATEEPVEAPPTTAKPTKRAEILPDERTKLSAADFVRAVAESAGSASGAPVEIPVPADPAVLASLVDVWVGNAPGYEYPSWVYEACFASASTQPRVALGRRVFDEVVANDLIDRGEPEVLAALADNASLEEVTVQRLAAVRAGTPAPRPDEYPPSERWPVPSRPSSFLRWTGDNHRENGRGDGLAEAAYRHGILGPTELLDALPTVALLPLPSAWRNRIVGDRIRTAAEALVAQRLGTDRELWLRALTAMYTGAQSEPLPTFLSRITEPVEPVEPVEPNEPHETAEPTEAAETAASAPLTWDAVSSHERVGFDRAAGFGSKPYRWQWPAGRLLLLAGPEALAVLLPELGPDAFSTLWAFADFVGYHSGEESNALIDYAFAAPDRSALHAVAWADRSRDTRTRILRLDDPELNATLYQVCDRVLDAPYRRVILSRVPQGRTGSGPGDLLAWDPVLREHLLRNVRISADTLPELRARIEAADVEVIEHAVRLLHKKASLTEQLIAIRGLLRYGGADRITDLVEQGRLGATAARVVVKALRQADPETTLTERIDRERTFDKLLVKLRRCTGGYYADVLLTAGHPHDWDAFLAEHAREPFPSAVWHRLVAHPDSPPRALEPGRLHPTIAREAGLRSAAHARAAVAHGHAALGDVDWYRFVDRAVEAELLTGRDLVHEARGAGTVLNWVAEAVHRIEVPDAIRLAGIEAAEEIASLATTRLGVEQEAWDRVFAALAGNDSTWDREASGSTIAALLSR